MDNGALEYSVSAHDLRRSANSHEQAAEDRHVRDVLGILRRSRLLILSCTAIIVAVTIFFTRRVTPIYEATTSIRIDERQPSLPALDALQGFASTNEVTTEMAELGSRSVAEEVTEALALRLEVVEPERTLRREILAHVTAGRAADSGSYQLRRQPDGRFRIESGGTGAALGVVAPGQPAHLGTVTVVLAPTAVRYRSIDLAVHSFEAAVATLQAKAKILRPSRDANIIAVQYQGTDPEVVRDVTNAVATHFIQRRQDVRQTETRSTVTFLRKQLKRLSVQLAAAEDELRSFREREDIVDLPEEERSQVGHVAELQAQRNTLDAERSALARLLEEVQTTHDQQSAEGASSYRRLVAFPTLLRSQAASELLGSLTAAEDRRSDLLTRRTMKDPDVQLMTGRIHQLEDQLRVIATTYLQGLASQVASYDAVLRESGVTLGNFPAKEIKLARLQRQAKGLEEIYTLLQTRLKEGEVAEAVEDASVRVVDIASLPRAPIRPKPVLNITLAALSGLLLGISLAFAREYIDQSVHTRNELQAIAGNPVLGLIPHFHKEGQLTSRIVGAAQRLTGIASHHVPVTTMGREWNGTHKPNALQLANRSDARAMAEAFQRLATNIIFLRPDKPVKRLVLTSSLPGDGKTVVAVNVAVALAQRGRRVLLVDADLRRGMISTVCRLRREPGLSSIVLGSVPLSEARRELGLGGNDSLHVLTTGALQDNPAPVLAGDRIRTLLDQVENDYDLIIFDSPPINVVTDAALLSSSCDAVLLVARAGVTAVPAVALAVEQLRQVRAPIVGSVLNDIDFERDVTYDGSYRYYGHAIPYETNAVG